MGREGGYGYRQPRVGALVEDDGASEREDRAVGEHGGLELEPLLPRLAGGGEVLGAVLDPLHRRLEQDARPAERDVLAIQHHLVSERTADVARHDADRLRRQPERARQREAEPVRVLRAGRVGELACGGVVVRDPCARLERHVCIPLLAEARAHDTVRGGERPVDVAPRRDGVERDVAHHPVEQRRLRRQRLRGRSHGLERLVLHGDEREGVLRDVAALGHDERDRIADVKHPVLGQRPERRLVSRHPETFRHRLQLVGGEDSHHAREGTRVVRVETTDPGMRIRAAEKRRLRHAGWREVGDEATTPGEQARVLHPRDTRAHVARRSAHGRSRLSSASGVRNPSGPSALLPPSHARSVPVTKLAWSEQRKSTASATSPGSAKRRRMWSGSA